jgi:tRNA(adenine34) deaminase
MQYNQINYFMSVAQDEAEIAFTKEEVPIGCVITNEFGDIIGRGHNLKETEHNACHHAEILAIAEASKKNEAWRLTDCSLFVTLEPCPMCLSAISQARIKNVYFGAYDAKGGAISLGLGLHNDPRLNHKLNVFGGYKHIECAKTLSNFFKAKRKKYKK